MHQKTIQQLFQKPKTITPAYVRHIFQPFSEAGYQPYGLQQVNGGPCGVLAVIQAFVIRALHIRAPSPGALLEAGVMGMGEDEYIYIYIIIYIRYMMYILYDDNPSIVMLSDFIHEQYYIIIVMIILIGYSSF